jgi:hypothetical protein
MATKKKAAAKKAAKKATKSTTAAEVEIHSSAFNLLDMPPTHESTRAALTKALGRRKGRVISLHSASEERTPALPSVGIYMDWALNNRGLPRGVTNLIGKDGVGKSSFLFYMLSRAMCAGSVPVLSAGERKYLPAEWKLRLAHWDKATSLKIVERMEMLNASVLDQMWEEFVAWVKIKRDSAVAGHIPPHVPLIGAFDSLNKFGTSAQGAGLAQFGGMDKEEDVDLADRGHSLDRARWYHDMAVRTETLRTVYNTSLLISEHTNQDKPMGGGAKTQSFLPEHFKEAKNRTKPGGEAINQTAHIQLTLVDCGQIYSAGEAIARRIMVSVWKSSYGPSRNKRTCHFALKEGDYRDTETTWDQGLRWDYTTVEWLAAHGHLGMTRSGSSMPLHRYNCPRLGISQASLEDAAQAYSEAPETLWQELGEQLKIPGYYDPFKEIQSSILPD